MDGSKTWFAVIITIVVSVALLYECASPKIKTAQGLEQHGNYAGAYQEYANLIIRRASQFKVPMLGENASSEDVGKWIGSLVSHYLSYRARKPKGSDCTAACQKLRELESHLTSFEHRFSEETSKELSHDKFMDIWHPAAFARQKTLPQSIRDEAEKAFNERLSIVNLKGDFDSYVEGILYNASLDVAVPFKIKSDAYKGPAFLLEPGEWMILSRVVPRLSNPNSKTYYEAHHIVGEYAATFITIPDTPHLISYALQIDESMYSPP